MRKGGRAELSYSPQIAGFPSVLQCWRRGLLLQEKKKKSGHTVEIIIAVQISPPRPLVFLSLSLSVSPSLSGSLCEAPADSGCIHPYINHSPYSIGYMVHGKYWFFPLPHCWRTLGFCETEKEKEKKKKRQTKPNKTKSSSEFSLDKKLSGRFEPSSQ